MYETTIIMMAVVIGILAGFVWYLSERVRKLSRELNALKSNALKDKISNLNVEKELLELKKEILKLNKKYDNLDIDIADLRDRNLELLTKQLSISKDNTELWAALVKHTQIFRYLQGR